MPLNAGRSGVFVSLVLVSVLGVSAQTPPQTSASPSVPPIGQPIGVRPNLPSAADIMRARLEKAKAYIAVKNHAAAIYELEGIKRESKDPSVSGVIQVMLMNCYLEQLDYKRAQSFLTEIFNAQKANKPNFNYFAVAGQVVRGARSQFDRYKSLGLSVADRNLPKEAAGDVDKMRETVEMVVAQSKTLGENKKLIPDAMALIEEASSARINLARDDYDANRWKEQMADARESLMSSRATIINAVEDSAPNINANNAVASNTNPIVPPVTAAPNPQIVPVSSANTNPPVKTDAPKTEIPAPTAETAKELEKTNVAEVPKQTEQNPIERNRLVETRNKPVEPAVNNPQNAETKTETTAASETTKDASPLQVGSLVEYATEKSNPSYPPAAKMMRKTGIVRVEVLVDEDGKIETVQKASGESMLQRAAVDALKKWKFKPFTRDGQPVKAAGFVNFNFNL